VKKCEKFFSQNLSFSPKFVKISRFEKKLAIFTNFGEKEKFCEKFSQYFLTIFPSEDSALRE
jgi:hypothetical protein